ncbi:MAG: cation:proton antiporter [Ilumatobacter sp.]|uniref:cation:proton antiporter n=1 Tax=Ilumatobacter sp. TaxID=1967498 RepID=UPI0032968399
MIGFLSWDLHIGWLVLGGIAMVAMVVLPRILHARPLSVPIIYVAVGFAAFSLSGELRGPRPLGIGFDSAAIEYATELIVIISLVGAGLRIERRPGLIRWNSVWRLLAIAMTLSILAAIGLAGVLLGLAAAPAILLAAVLAPTDPVLADDVQLGRPGEGDDERDEVRFTLTTEAGLNDGLAFPVVHLAIAVTTAGVAGSLLEWVAYDVGLRIALGLGMGLALGAAVNVFGNRTGEFFRNQTSEGLFSLGATILVYGLTEVVNGYGFLAVFVAALVRGAGDDDYRRNAHDFIEQIESILVAVALLAFGAVLSEGILDALTWPGVAFAVLFVFVVRPVAGWIALIGRPMPGRERIAIAFFGIRGLGSIYYLAYAANHADFGGALPEVWAVVSLTILLSIGVHGISASPLMRRLDLRRDEETPAGDDTRDLESKGFTP